MASKNIAITKKLYDELSKRKQKDESFTKIIYRLLQRYDRPSHYFGVWQDMTGKEERDMDKLRKDLREKWSTKR
jgi:predicted CopG family antitoxin